MSEETAVLVGDTVYDVIRTNEGFHAYLDHRVAGRGPTIDAAVDDALDRRCDFDGRSATHAYEEFLVCGGCWSDMRAADRALPH